MKPAAGRAWWFEQPLSYERGFALQQALLDQRIRDEIPDTILLLQHTPVITLGRRGRTNFLLQSPDALAAAGIDLVHASRGGDVTWHGPGQLVMYPIRRIGQGAHGWLDLLQDCAIATARSFGVPAYAREGMNGAWIDAGKIAAIGFALKRWVSFHGLSLNVDCDLSGFEAIVGCGLQGQSVASMATVLGEASPAIGDVAARLLEHVEQLTGDRYEYTTQCLDNPDGEPARLLAAVREGCED